MGTLAYPFEIRDSANSTTDNRKTGLAGSIAVGAGKTIAATPATVAASNVAIVEITGGHYAALYDPEAHGDAAFPLDCGATLGNPNDRYLTLDLTRDSGRILAGFNAAGQVALADGTISSAKFTVASYAGPAAGIVERIDQLWRRFFRKTTKAAGQIRTYADDGATTITTQAATDDGTTQTQGAAS